MAVVYYQERDRKNIEKINELLQELPYFCREFFVGIENITSTLTRKSYAYDFKIFFHFLTTEVPDFFNINIRDFSLKDLDKVTSSDIEFYLSYLSYYKIDGSTFSNLEHAKARKLSSLKSLFKYFFNKDKLTKNVAAKVAMPKIHEKEIIRLETNEVSKILNCVENGNGLSPTQMKFHNATKVRDLAILTVFLGTGVRISELVGLNLEDIDFNLNGFVVTRKGGDRVVLYFSDEVALALRNYIRHRNTLNIDKNERALFLSLQNKRLSVRSVENLVKKYAKLITPLKKITPHKLRSTYGTELYKETNDIYIVADVLGHKDVNTTRKHYAAISDDIRRNVANKVKLRDEEE